MAVFVNYDFFIVILDQAMPHLMFYFFWVEEFHQKNIQKQSKSYVISRALRIFYKFRNFVVFCTEINFSKLRNGLEIL